MDNDAATIVAGLLGPTPSASGRSSLKRYVFRIDVETNIEVLAPTNTLRLELLILATPVPTTFGFIEFKSARKSTYIKKELGVKGELWWVGLTGRAEWAFIKERLMFKVPGLMVMKPLVFEEPESVNVVRRPKALELIDFIGVVESLFDTYLCKHISLLADFGVIKKNKKLNEFLVS